MLDVVVLYLLCFVGGGPLELWWLLVNIQVIRGLVEALCFRFGRFRGQKVLIFGELLFDFLFGVYFSPLYWLSLAQSPLGLALAVADYFTPA